MGISHRKKFRRYVDFYQTSFGFYEPFKILIDGNFLHLIDALKQGDVLEVLQNSFSRRLRLFSTPCVINELRALGHEFQTTVSNCEKLDQHHCNHRTPISAADCLLSCVGETNNEHWWIATQDKMLRETLSQVSGTPCLFLTYSGLFMETPSEASRKAVKKAQEEVFNVAEWELSTDALKDLKKISKEHKKSIFRKKKAKGPNPLSCLPKKQAELSTDDVTKEKRKRQRRRKKKMDKSETMDSSKTSE